MISPDLRNTLALYFAGSVLALGLLLLTYVFNQEIADSRLREPVASIGTLAAAECGANVVGARGASPQHYALTTHTYSTAETGAARHQLVSKKKLRSKQDCEAYLAAIGETATVWYERSMPGKASLVSKQAYYWDLLYCLVVPALFFIAAISSHRTYCSRLQPTSSSRSKT